MAARILLTRPRERGDALMQACRAYGFEVSHVPLQTLHPLNCAAPALEPLPSAIVVVSVTAAHYGAERLPVAWQQRCPLIAVGHATAAALAQLGWSNAITPTHENSEALVQLECLQNIAGKRVVLLRGEIGREVIGDTLRARGANVDTLILYRSVGPTPDDVTAIQTWAQTAGVVVISSTQALMTLCAIIPPPARHGLRVLCLGSRIAAAAHTHFEHVSVIAALTAEAINDAL